MALPNNEFSYLPRIFNALKTFATFKRRFEAEKNPRTKWMLGRRASDHMWFAFAQERNNHFVAGESEAEVFCSCGLVTPNIRDFDRADSVPAAGHWSHRDNALAQVFVWFQTLYCAGCDFAAPAEFDEDDNPKVDWDALRELHKACGFDRFKTK
jgi:hypothetical protein